MVRKAHGPPASPGSGRILGPRARADVDADARARPRPRPRLRTHARARPRAASKGAAREIALRHRRMSSRAHARRRTASRLVTAGRRGSQSWRAGATFLGFVRARRGGLRRLRVTARRGLGADCWIARAAARARLVAASRVDVSARRRAAPAGALTRARGARAHPRPPQRARWRGVRARRVAARSRAFIVTRAAARFSATRAPFRSVTRQPEFGRSADPRTNERGRGDGSGPHWRRGGAARTAQAERPGPGGSEEAQGGGGTERQKARGGSEKGATAGVERRARTRRHPGADRAEPAGDQATRTKGMGRAEEEEGLGFASAKRAGAKGLLRSGERRGRGGAR